MSGRIAGDQNVYDVLILLLPIVRVFLIFAMTGATLFVVSRSFRAGTPVWGTLAATAIGGFLFLVGEAYTDAWFGERSITVDILPVLAVMFLLALNEFLSTSAGTSTTGVIIQIPEESVDDLKVVPINGPRGENDDTNGRARMTT